MRRRSHRGRQGLYEGWENALAELWPREWISWEVALSCGGRIVVGEPFAGQTDAKLGLMLASGLDRRERALLLSYDGAHCLISKDGIVHKGKSCLPPALIAAAQDHIRSGGSTEEIEWGNSNALFRVLDCPQIVCCRGGPHSDSSVVCPRPQM